MLDICEILGTEYPIIQGAMARIADAKLAAAVSEGGGLGIIASGGETAEWLRGQIALARSLTEKPFGVNLMLLSPNIDELVDVVCDEKIKVVTTGAGNPGKYMSKLKAAGIKVIPVVASVALAVRMEREGADAVIAEGTEAGGHIGEISTMALTPQVVDAVGIPVICAGGIGDGRGVAAAFMFGAKGVQVGTRFLTATECGVAQEYKDAIISAKDTSTTATGRKYGHPVRCLRNKLTRRVLKLEAEGGTEEEMNAMCTGSLAAAVRDGDVQNGSVMSGQIAGLIKKEQPAAEIIRELFSEAAEIYSRRQEICEKLR